MSIAVPDLDRAREFYGVMLGLGPPVFDLPEAGWIEFETGSSTGNLAVTLADGEWKPGTGTTIVLNTADCGAGASSCALAASSAMTRWCFRVT